MRIETGKGKIPLLTLLGIWSVSALTSLPGLAVSPVLGKLSSVFGNVSELEIQMLTSLPSLLIIPSVLIAGWFTERLGYIRLLYCGLWMFFICGVLYFFCSQMWQLIAVSALLGVGAGIIVPLSTALISRFFKGEYRTRQFGYSSAITNVTLVIATFVTGCLAEWQWRLPFSVYLLPVFSIVMLPFISRADNIPVSDNASLSGQNITVTTDMKHIMLYMVYYFLITYLTVVISFNLPFLLEEYGYESGSSGTLISLFFLSIMLPGFFLSPVIKMMNGRVEWVCLLVIGVGLLIIYAFDSLFMIAIGCIITGLGYGIAQPYIYDRVANVATPIKTTFALALVMSMNYVAILICPFIVDFMQKVSHVNSERFAFGLNVVITVLAIFAILLRRIANVYK